MRFNNKAELEQYAALHGIVASVHQAVLLDTNGEPTPVPADQVQHYLDKGFKWPE